jgi:hypothetical protein
MPGWINFGGASAAAIYCSDTPAYATATGRQRQWSGCVLGRFFHFAVHSGKNGGANKRIAAMSDRAGGDTAAALNAVIKAGKVPNPCRLDAGF